MHNRFFANEITTNSASSNQHVKNLIQTFIDEWNKELRDDYENLRRASSDMNMPIFCINFDKFKSELVQFRGKIDFVEQLIKIIDNKQLVLTTLRRIQHGEMINVTDQRLLNEQINNESHRIGISIKNIQLKVGSYLAEEYPYTHMGNEMIARDRLSKLHAIVSQYPGIKTDSQKNVLRGTTHRTRSMTH